MESQLKSDLLEVLDGIDPLELITDDPDLEAIVRDLCHDINSSGDVTCNKDLPIKTKRTNNKVCCVCGKSASRFRYFGAVVCNSCRAFFARSIKNDSYQSYICQDNLEMGCSLVNKKISCHKCRFELCLKEGMAVSGKDLQNSSRSNGSGSDYNGLLHLLTKKSMFNRSKMLQPPLGLFTVEETKSLEKEMHFHVNISTSNTFKLMIGNLDMYRGWLQFIFHGTPLPIGLQKQMDKYLNYSNKEDYMKTTKLGMWNGIGFRDRLRLATANIPLMVLFLLTSRYIGKDVDYEQEVLGYVELLKKMSDGQRKENITKIFKEVSQDGSLRPRPIDYDYQYCSDILNATKEDSNKYEVATMKLSQCSFNLHRSAWDPIASMLTTSLILYTPDFLDLDEPKKVEDVQATYACLLHKYLRSTNYVNRGHIFSNAMMASSYARDLHEIREKSYQKLH